VKEEIVILQKKKSILIKMKHQFRLH